MASYALRLYDPLGGFVATLDVIASLEMALPANDVGALSLVLPILYPLALFQKDGRIVVERTVRGVTKRSVWLIRKVEHTLDQGGAKQLRVTAFDPRDILRRRIVAVASQATKEMHADDMMKHIVSENFVSALDASRNLPASLLTVAGDQSAGGEIAMEFPNRNVLDVLRDIATEVASSTCVAFDVVPSGTGFEFRTYTGVWGVDRRAEVLLSPERGTLAEVGVTQDWTEEYTAVYSSMRGTEVISGLTVDNDRIALSPLGRIEHYLNASNATTIDAQESALSTELQAGRAREQFSARLVEQPGLRYGVDLYLGDLVIAEHEGTRYDCRVEPVSIKLAEDGSETVDVQLRNIA